MHTIIWCTMVQLVQQWCAQSSGALWCGGCTTNGAHNQMVQLGAPPVVHTIIWCTAPTDVPSATCRVTFPASNLRHSFLTASHPVCHIFLHATRFSSCTQPSALQLVKWPNARYIFFWLFRTPCGAVCTIWEEVT